ncbi:hypothetical protein XU19_20035 [Vibrio parahaemolyticus]|nr:hypothetical protein XU19_20035 [Vibrio parahaemolyticus]KKY44355.1 hypothetical protein AAY51_01455 [Vibrio parahaemolyticus]KOP98941.1 hypothetical protein AL012_01450 [Citrobacter amalonaticus]KOQ00551.1 hypothetical protein ALC61_04460 [Citrobacter amalonaticus]HAU5794296.1 hypothetical protein [Citrobacter amalonaticus]
MLILNIFVSLGIALAPLTLWATAMSIKNYKGPMAWRILAMLAVIKGILSYISFCLQTVIEFTTV